MRCPDCGDPLAQSGVCGSCGYGRSSKPKGAPVDPSWWRCTHVDRGQRCAKAGTIAHTTHGTGPYFCLAHAFPNHGVSGPRLGPQTLRQALANVDPYEALERAAIQAEGECPTTSPA